MKIEKGKVDEVIQYLSSQWQSGEKWVAYQNNDAPLQSRDLKCFANSREADHYCATQLSYENHFHFKAIPSVLRSLNEMKLSAPMPIDAEGLLQAINKESTQLSISPGAFDHLSRGEIYPIVYKSAVGAKDQTHPKNEMEDKKVFAQYHASDKQLVFYDNHLNKVELHNKMPAVDAQLFDRHHQVQIGQSFHLKQEGQHMTNELKYKHRL